jgi:hypothetical protein
MEALTRGEVAQQGLDLQPRLERGSRRGVIGGLCDNVVLMLSAVASTEQIKPSARVKKGAVV